MMPTEPAMLSDRFSDIERRLDILESENAMLRAELRRHADAEVARGRAAEHGGFIRGAGGR